MIIKNIKPFKGQHCETTATGTLLKNIAIDISEPMLFGLGKGLGFIYWNMKLMEFPFLGGRIKPEQVTINLAKNLNLTLDVQETSSIKKAWVSVKSQIDAGSPVGLKLDCYYLDYFTNKIHFAAHYVAMYGYDDKYAYLVDTVQQGTSAKATLANLELARAEKGPMSSKNLFYTVKQKSKLSNMAVVVKKAITENAKEYLNPPIQNIGYKGIAKASKELKKWYLKSKNPTEHIKIIAMLMEKGGTGGALFRNLYRDFLKESMNIIPSDNLEQGYQKFIEISQLWTYVANNLQEVGKTKDIRTLDEACNILNVLSIKEKEAMEKLVKLA